MPKIIKLQHTNEYPPILLEKGEDGLYTFPTMRCGILPYYRRGHQIIWGCVKSNRVGPTTIVLPAGIQDILVIKDEHRFVLEAGKPVPVLKFDFLQNFAGKMFRDQIYQDIITCLIEHKFEIYIENPLVTALHETHEEHGVDLRKNEGRNHYLLNTLIQLPIQRLSGKRGATTQSFWVAELSSPDGIVLNDTIKIENKIRRNFGREFYEQGCWGTLSEFNDALLGARNFSSDPSQTHRNTDLVTGVIEAFEEMIELLEGMELLIRADFKKSSSLPGEHSFFSKSYQKNEQKTQETLTSKTALYDTGLVPDLDNVNSTVFN